MPASIYMPDITVEIAFASTPDDPAPTWTDVSDYVEAEARIGISRGRSDELTEVQPSRLTVTLDNSDGRFTPGNMSSPYYPNVRKSRKIRVSVVWPLGGGGVTYRRFTGYVDEWPVTWPTATDQYSAVTISASSRRARLAVGTELPSIIETEYLADDPTAYYPLGEASPAGGTPGQAGDVSGNQQPVMVATGTGSIQWQAATGPGTDSLSAPVFPGGRYLENTIDGVNTTSVTLEMFVNTTDVPAGGVLNGLAHYARLTLAMTSAGDVIAEGQSNSVNPHGSTVINDGETHHVAYRETVSGGNVTGTLFIDGVQDATATGALDTSLPSSGRLHVGRSQFLSGLTEGWQGVIAHAAVTSGATELSNARILAHATSGLTGFSGESTDARIDRLAGYAGVPVATVSTETGLTTSIINQDTTGRTPIDLMDEVTFTEGGLLFDAADGTLTFHARDHRYNATSQFTLDAGPAEQHLEASLEAKMDGQQLVNDITATGGSSIVVRVANTDSITEHGVRRDQIELLTLVDNEVYDAANWRVQRYGEPDVRITAVEVDLIAQDSALISELLGTELGTRITLNNLPAQAPATSVDMFIEGINESIGAEFYTIVFDLSPVTLSDVWQLDSASFSQLGTTTILAY